MSTDEFAERLAALRPRLHRYCARMTGSTVDGEDVLQNTYVKVLSARAEGASVDNLEGWLFRIAHNASLDLLRRRSRNTVVPLAHVVETAPMPEADILAVGFQTFLQLPELQRCAVILKDVLGHSVDEIASIAECTPAAAKSALQRGRAALRQLARMPTDTRLPLMMSEAVREKMAAFVDLFRAGDFDAIRATLADDVKLDLVNRLKLDGRDKIVPYFTRYAEEDKWRFAFGAVEGRPAMLVFERGAMDMPAYFVLVEWRHDQIAAIRDFLFAPYALESVDWVRLSWLKDEVGLPQETPPR